MTRQRRWQLARAAAGLCAKCPEPRVNATHCEKHRVDHHASIKVGYARRRRPMMVLHLPNFVTVEQALDWLDSRGKTVRVCLTAGADGMIRGTALVRAA